MASNKNRIDSVVIHYISKRLLDPIENTSAYKRGYVDDFGSLTESANTPGSQDSFTDLDRFLIFIRKMVGEDKLKRMLEEYAWTRNQDELSLMSKFSQGSCDDLKRNAPVYEKIVGSVEGKDFLPKGYQGDGSYVQESDIPFDQRLSKALTTVTYLLYALGNKRVPDEQIINSVKSSVENTFKVSAFPDLKDIQAGSARAGLMSKDGITSDGKKLVLSIARIADPILFESSHPHNQTSTWRKLGCL